MKGQVYKIYSDLYYVKSEDNIYVCKIREIIKKQKKSIVAGDYVEFEQDVINNILPRESFIRRPAVANVDQIVVVSALKQPELDFHQLNGFKTAGVGFSSVKSLCISGKVL